MVEWKLAGKTKVLGGNLAQFNFVHQETLKTWPGVEPGS